MPPLLDIRDLHVRFDTDAGRVHAVDGVSLTVARGEILGLVGESGCGKSALALSVPRLLPMPPARIEAGAITLDGEDLAARPPEALRALRGRRIGVIFQEPTTALSPLHRIGDQIAEAISLHRRVSRAEMRTLVREWLVRVGIPDPEQRVRCWPHELSGGMQQRIMIAMALVHDPDLVIADEPTTALDVTTQAQVLDLMRKLRRASSGLLLITHDMGVVWEMATRVAVMYAGQIVETAPCDTLFATPEHPYTQALLAAVPVPDPTVPRPRVPAAFGPEIPGGCPFQAGCPMREGRCASLPPLVTVAPGHLIRCHLTPGGD